MPAPAKTVLRRTARTLAVVLGVLAVFAAGVLAGGHPQTTRLVDLPPPVRDVVLGADEAPVREVVQTLRRGYYREVDPERLERASIDALLRELDDPYTFYLDPEQYAAYQRDVRGLLVGIGVNLRAEDDDIVVTRVFEGSSAARGGLRVGDVLVRVDGQDVRGRPLDDVVGRIRGPEGTEVRLALRRDGRVRDVTLRRAPFRVPTVTSRVETHDGAPVGYVRLSSFDRGSAREVRDAVDALGERGVRAYVLDLRGDPGGLLDEAVGVSGVFLPDRSPVVTIEGLHRARRTLRTLSLIHISEPTRPY